MTVNEDEHEANWQLLVTMNQIKIPAAYGDQVEILMHLAINSSKVFLTLPRTQNLLIQ